MHNPFFVGVSGGLSGRGSWVWYDCQMKRTVAITFIVIILSSIAYAEDNIKQLQEVFSHIPNASLGNRMQFENEIDTHQCAPLSIDNRLIAWVYKAHNTGKRVFIMQCLEDKNLKLSHAIAGYLEFGLFILDPMDKWKPTLFEVPEYNYFSNPSFCNSKMAFWGIERVKVIKDVIDYNRFETSLLIIDFDSNKIIARKDIGIFILETDYRGHLAMPSWDDKCNQASFFASQHMKKAVPLSIK